MNISELFIRRPVMTTLVMLGDPALRDRWATGSSRSATCRTSTSRRSRSRRACPGASPETMASAVATPLERQFSTIAGLDNMTSTSIARLDPDHAPVQPEPQHRRAPRRTCRRRSPPRRASCRRTCRRPPSYQKVNPADQPILYLALTSPTLPLSQLDEYGETMMAQRISTVSGVAQVQVYGSQKYAVRVQLDPRALASRGIGIDEVVRGRRSPRTSTCRPARSTGRTRPSRSRRRAS